MATSEFEIELDPKTVTAAVETLIADGVTLREVLHILNTVYFEPKNLWVIQRHQMACVVMQHQPPKKLFLHVSLARCIEYALKYEPGMNE